MCMQTTIRLNPKIKSNLDEYRQYKNESYNEVIRKLLFIVKTCIAEPKLSQKTVLDIQKARENIMKGDFYTEDEAKKILGL
jgi:hypothetical protein